MVYLKLVQEQELAKHKTSRREIIKIRTEVNEIETKKKKTKNLYKQSVKQKADSLKKIYKIDKLLTNLTKRGGKRT
jgi:hypothetical protein